MQRILVEGEILITVTQTLPRLLGVRRGQKFVRADADADRACWWCTSRVIIPALSQLVKPDLLSVRAGYEVMVIQVGSMMSATRNAYGGTKESEQFSRPGTQLRYTYLEYLNPSMHVIGTANDKQPWHWPNWQPPSSHSSVRLSWFKFLKRNSCTVKPWGHWQHAPWPGAHSHWGVLLVPSTMAPKLQSASCWPLPLHTLFLGCRCFEHFPSYTWQFLAVVRENWLHIEDSNTCWPY